MNIMELDSLQTMLGKAVEIDGCCVGHLADMTLEQALFRDHKENGRMLKNNGRNEREKLLTMPYLQW